jgi:hypothetical protein
MGSLNPHPVVWVAVDLGFYEKISLTFDPVATQEGGIFE